MTRREALRNTALISGYALAMPSLAAILQSCAGQKRPEWLPNFFSQGHADMITEIVEMLLPHTEDLPGAWDLGVHAFVDKFVGMVFEAEDQEKFKGGLDDITQQCQTAYGKPFMECSKEQQYELLNKIDVEQRAKVKEQPNEDIYWPTFLKIKDVAFLGYFTHEKIGMDVLVYDPIPGVYQGCIPVTEVGGGKRTWAL
ncbi:MAG: gluconate 2-dehydrogenase subunit 3 family protein [Saprospiraceae bacterium]|nr:gluconate 2-dehydrogenase subunit 3 family protein [Saprospiraceae bacterium]